MLYNITFRPYDDATCLVPRVPYSAADDEDQETERVCFADTVEHCMSAICPCDRELRTGGIVIVRSVDESTLDQDKLIRPQELYESRRVPDALETNEHWYLDEVKVKREVYEIVSFSAYPVVAFTCLVREDVDEIIRWYDPEHPLLPEESLEQGYDRVLKWLDETGQLDKYDEFEEYIARLPWARIPHISGLVMKKVG